MDVSFQQTTQHRKIGTPGQVGALQLSWVWWCGRGGREHSAMLGNRSHPCNGTSKYFVAAEQGVRRGRSLMGRSLLLMSHLNPNRPDNLRDCWVRCRPSSIWTY